MKFSSIHRDDQSRHYQDSGLPCHQSRTPARPMVRQGRELAAPGRKYPISTGFTGLTFFFAGKHAIWDEKQVSSKHPVDITAYYQYNRQLSCQMATNMLFSRKVCVHGNPKMPEFV
jgi:hypothetical protein